MARLPMERQRELLSIINSRGIVSIQELAEQTEVSESTLRRDLRKLEQESQIRIGRGGVAALGGSSQSLGAVYMPQEHQAEKSRVGAKAAELLEDNETVFFDCGSTILEMVKAVDPKCRFTCITNSLAVANAMCDKPQVEVIILGGAVNVHDKSVTGSMAINNLREFHIDRYFLGAAGVSEDKGVTGFNLNLIEVRRRVVELCNQVTVIVDTAKFSKTGMSRVMSIDTVDRIVTNSEVPQEVQQMLENHNVELILA